MVFVDTDKSNVHHLVKFPQSFRHAAPNFRGLHFALVLLFDRADDSLDQFLPGDFRNGPLAAGNIDALQDFAGVKGFA